jgi:hypothetical protein
MGRIGYGTKTCEHGIKKNAGKIFTLGATVRFSRRTLLRWSYLKLALFNVCNNDVYCVDIEIKGRLNSGNACYHSVQSLLSSHLLSRNVKVRIYKTIILPVVSYGCEIWSLTLKEEHRLRLL